MKDGTGGAKLRCSAALVLAATTLAACGGGHEEAPPDLAEFEQACAETPGCAEPRFQAPGPRETIWRVLVVREAGGAVRIERVDAVKVPEGDGVPVGPLSGSHRLAGLDGDGEPVDGQLLRFPNVARLESRGERKAAREIELGGEDVDAIGYVRALPPIETLAVLDESGSMVASRPVPTKEVVLGQERGSLLAGWAPALAHRRLSGAAAGLTRVPPAIPTMMQGGRNRSSWPYQHNLPPYCAHVLLLEGEADRDLARGLPWWKDVDLQVPGAKQRATVYGALGRMTPLLCQSIGRIAIGIIDLEDKDNILGAVHQVFAGDLILVNAASNYQEQRLRRDSYASLRMIGTILHEAGHAADALLNVQASRRLRFSGAWEPPSRTLASRTVERVRLEGGLLPEWIRVHESFEAVGWAQHHQSSEEAKEAVWAWSPRQVGEGGFMSRYGATAIPEDLADLVEWTYVSGSYLRLGVADGDPFKNDLACQEMRKHDGKDLPSQLAAVYTKLLFLQDLGLIAEEDAETCTGPHLGLPDASSGFHLWHAGNQLRSFARGVTAAIGTQPDGDRVFEMKAAGEAGFDDGMYPASLRLQLDLESRDVPIHEVPWPRGVYTLGLRGDNNVQLRLDGARAGNFDVMDGYALVAQASNDRIAGSIFVERVMRLHAPLPVPERYDPPLLIRFVIER